jgi:hypothetical protein
MTSITTKPDSLQPAAEMAVDLFDNWFDPIETEVRALIRYRNAMSASRPLFPITDIRRKRLALSLLQFCEGGIVPGRSLRVHTLAGQLGPSAIVARSLVASYMTHVTGGKIRVNSISWDDVKTILPDQVLEIRVRHGQTPPATAGPHRGGGRQARYGLRTERRLGMKRVPSKGALRMKRVTCPRPSTIRDRVEDAEDRPVSFGPPARQGPEGG